MLVGIGYDVHRFKKGRTLVLGGVTIPHAHGLDGHSDADVLIHALMDALLGSAGFPDIGHYFPNTDPRFQAISSLRLLAHVCAVLKKNKWKINNVDISLIAEAPKLYPHIAGMKTRLAAVMKLPVARIGIKATTNEGMGFIGRGEGIAAFAVASVRK